MSCEHVPVRGAVTIFSGFLQKLGSPGSGMVHLEHLCHVKCHGRPDVRVRLFPWHCDVDDVAEALWRYRPDSNGTNPRQLHVVVGYSYGGDRAVKFIRELQQRGGCDVLELWLCDAVRRWDYMPGIAGAFGLGKIRVPEIVQRCHYFVQRHARLAPCRSGGFYQPAGHVVTTDSQITVVKGPVVKPSTHAYIDNNLQFRNNVLEAVDRLLERLGDKPCDA